MVRADDALVHLVFPGNARADSAGVHAILGARRVRFVSPEELLALTGCVPGGVPPFGNLFGLPVLVDEALAQREEIAFDAGSRSVSIVTRGDGFVRLSGAWVRRLATR